MGIVTACGRIEYKRCTCVGVNHLTTYDDDEAHGESNT